MPPAISAQTLRELSEALVELKTALATLNARLDADEAEAQRLSGVQNDVLARLERAARPPWAVLIGAVSILLVVIAGVGGLVIRPLQEADTRLTEELRGIKTDALVYSAKHREDERADARELMAHTMSRDEIEARIRAAILEARIASK